MLLRMATSILLLFLPIRVAAAAAPSLLSDAQLIALVPPESRIVAGMRSPSSRNQPQSLLLITRENRIDLGDFFAITGTDTSRSFHQVILVAADGRRGWLSDHSLLVSGHFDRDAVQRFAYGGKATVESYEGFTILAVPAFARELSTLNEVRWLAILDSNLAVFGSIASVQHEIDRYRWKSVPDPLLVERLSRLGRAMDAWCLLPSPGPGVTIPPVLEKLDPKFAEVSGRGGSMQYGFHFGRKVEVIASINADPQTNWSGRGGESAGASTSAFHFLARSNQDGSDGSDPVDVKVPLDRYSEWLARYSNRANTEGAPPPR